MCPTPVISVITPSYNRAGFIQTAIDSVLAQEYSAFEHIIIDGDSTDGTLKLLTSYPHLKVVSERDKGVYDALNKGIALAQGEIVAQLNSDDKYEPGIFSMISDLFRENPDIDAISAGARVYEVRSEGERTIAEYNGISQAELAYRATLGAPIFNAWFFRKDLFRKIGNYSLDYPLIADRDFLLRCYLGKISHLHINKVVYHYCQHPQSLTMSGRRELRDAVYYEVLTLVDRYIDMPLDLSMRRMFLKWRDQASIELFISSVRHRSLKDCIRISVNAIKKTPFWPLSLIAGSLMRLKNLINKKYVNKS